MNASCRAILYFAALTTDLVRDHYFAVRLISSSTWHVCTHQSRVLCSWGWKKELFLSSVPLNSSEQVLILAEHHISYRVGRPNCEGRLLLFLNSPLTHTHSGWAKTPSRAHAEGKTRGKFDDNLTHFTRFELSLSLQRAQMRFFPFLIISLLRSLFFQEQPRKYLFHFYFYHPK